MSETTETTTQELDRLRRDVRAIRDLLSDENLCGTYLPDAVAVTLERLAEQRNGAEELLRVAEEGWSEAQRERDEARASLGLLRAEMERSQNSEQQAEDEAAKLRLQVKDLAGKEARQREILQQIGLLLPQPVSDPKELPEAVAALVREREEANRESVRRAEERDRMRDGWDGATRSLKAVEKALEDATGEPVPMEMSLAEAVAGLIEDLEARRIQAETALERLALKLPAEAGTTEPLPPLHERYAETLHGLAGELERPQDRLEALRLGVVALTGPEVAARRAR